MPGLIAEGQTLRDMQELVDDLKVLAAKYENSRTRECRAVSRILSGINGALLGGGLEEIEQWFYEFAKYQIAILTEKLRKENKNDSVAQTNRASS